MNRFDEKEIREYEDEDWYERAPCPRILQRRNDYYLLRRYVCRARPLHPWRRRADMPDMRRGRVGDTG